MLAHTFKIDQKQYFTKFFILVGEPLSCDQRKSEGEGVVSDDGSKTEKREQMRERFLNNYLSQLERETGGRGGDPTQVWLSQTQQRLSSAETPGREKCTPPQNETLGSLSFWLILCDYKLISQLMTKFTVHATNFFFHLMTQTK